MDGQKEQSISYASRLVFIVERGGGGGWRSAFIISLVNLPCTLRNATEDSLVPAAFVATHWYRPSSTFRAS